MLLVRFGRARWAVDAVCSDAETCLVFELIAQLDEKRAARVLADLKTHVPNSDPQDWVRDDFSKMLRDGIYEFRWPTHGGATPRVLWFYDRGRLIVCCNGVSKKGKLRRQDMDAAVELRKQYFEDQARGALRIIDLDEFMREDSQQQIQE